MITEITTHSERAKSRLPSQFDGAVNLQALIEIFSNAISELESVGFDLYTKRNISVATGKQLDNLGTILNTERIAGDSDIEYRAALFSATSQLEKSGEAETLISLFKYLANCDSVLMQEYFPAGVSLNAITDADIEDSVLDLAIIEAMNIAKSGGIEIDLRFSPLTTAFEFSDVSEVDVNNNAPLDANSGFGDESLTEGGGLSRVIQ